MSSLQGGVYSSCWCWGPVPEKDAKAPGQSLEEDVQPPMRGVHCTATAGLEVQLLGRTL